MVQTSICDRSSPGKGGGVNNMLRVRVCAAHMGGFFGHA